MSMQPICWPCWDLRQLGRTPALRSEVLAHCCFCGDPTRDGLRTLVDPALVRYPQEVRELNFQPRLSFADLPSLLDTVSEAVDER